MKPKLTGSYIFVESERLPDFREYILNRCEDVSLRGVAIHLTNIILASPKYSHIVPTGTRLLRLLNINLFSSSHATCSLAMAAQIRPVSAESFANPSNSHDSLGPATNDATGKPHYILGIGHWAIFFSLTTWPCATARLLVLSRECHGHLVVPPSYTEYLISHNERQIGKLYQPLYLYP